MGQMTEPNTPEQEVEKSIIADFDGFLWYVGVFFSGTLLIPSPIFAFLFTPLFPLFLLTFFLPFIVVGAATSAFKKHYGALKTSAGFTGKLIATMLGGAVMGVPLWLAIAKSIIGGHYL